MKPSEKYHEFLKQSGFFQDTAQQHAVLLLDQLHATLSAPEPSVFEKVTRYVEKLSGKHSTEKGLYFWGGVGRGKTFLMDIFYESLPIREKKRIHFHQFMKQIHDQLALRGKGEDPLQEIAKEVVSHSRVLCLDEFVVTDIGDAMLIGRLLTVLFQQGTILVTTSNSPPDELYKDGLQRDNFLPAIEQLKQHCDICNLDGGKDYRMLGLSDTKLYQHPHNEAAEAEIRKYLQAHLVGAKQHSSLEINDRQIEYEYCAEDTVWFSFEQICKTARSRLDFLEIAQMFHTLIITGIEQMGEQSNDIARRFISLIDVLYDHKVKLICTAEVAHSELYRDGKLAFEFQRTASRLHEMQSQDYMALPHQI